MEPSRSFKRTIVPSLLAGFLLIMTGCAGMDSNQYAGDGELDIQRHGFFDQTMRLTLNHFDARTSYQNHRKILKIPKVEQPHYFQLRIEDPAIYAALYHSAAYNWEGYGGDELLKSSVRFLIRGPDGDKIVTTEKPLSRFPLTSPESGVVDFLLFSYRPQQNMQLRRIFSRNQPILIEFDFSPNSTQTTGDRINARLILESGSK